MLTELAMRTSRLRDRAKSALVVAMLVCIALHVSAATSRLSAASPGSTNADNAADSETAGDKTCKNGAADDAPAEAGKIWNGVPATNQRSTVAIRFTNQWGRSDLCSGVFIAENAVLTAGHCSCGTNHRLLMGPDAGDDLDARAVVHIPRRDVRAHPNFNCRTFRGLQGSDYAVIKFEPTENMKHPVTGKPDYDIASVVSPTVAHNTSTTGNNLRVVGYGRTEAGTDGKRLKTLVPVYSWFCHEPWATSRNCIPFKEMILSDVAIGHSAGADTNRDTCGGDSGGPVFALTRGHDKCGALKEEQYLVAITSRAMALRSGDGASNKLCGGGGIYEVVDRRSIRRWLRSEGVTLRRGEPGRSE